MDVLVTVLLVIAIALVFGLAIALVLGLVIVVVLAVVVGGTFFVLARRHPVNQANVNDEMRATARLAAGAQKIKLEPMQPLTEAEIRGSFTNTSPQELAHMTFPGLHEIVWEDREFLGWRDAHAIHRGYIVYWREGRPIGILLKAAGSRTRPGISAMCSLCRTPLPGGQVTLFTAPRAGQAGIDGSTVGYYICSDLTCSMLIRIVPPRSEMQPDPAEIITSRAEGLSSRLYSFTDDVLRAG